MIRAFKCRSLKSFVGSLSNKKSRMSVSLAVSIHSLFTSSELVLELEWLKIRDLFLGQNYVRHDVTHALELASACQHRDAVYLTHIFEGKEYSHKRTSEKSVSRSACRRRESALLLRAGCVWVRLGLGHAACETSGRARICFGPTQKTYPLVHPSQQEENLSF